VLEPTISARICRCRGVTDSGARVASLALILLGAGLIFTDLADSALLLVLCAALFKQSRT